MDEMFKHKYYLLKYVDEFFFKRKIIQIIADSNRILLFAWLIILESKPVNTFKKIVMLSKCLRSFILLFFKVN